MARVTLENISVRFRLYQSRDLKEAIFRRLKPRASLPSFEKSQEHWGLREVSLSLRDGDRLGIVGRNGAGKTTLLKVISRVYRPTSGNLKVEGRLAPLIEIGAGFSPELTGRENVLLNGSMLGLSRKELLPKMDSIFGFAELEKFADVPVKYFSTGMFLRLGFTIATQIPPDILILDELFAGSDVGFVQKADARLEEYIGLSKILIVVAHDLKYISRFCNRVLWLEQGTILRDGPPEEVLAAYLQASLKHPRAFAPEAQA